MYWTRWRYYKCYFCDRYSRDIVKAYMDGEYRIICIKCFLAYTLYETIREMLEYGGEGDPRHVIRVLEGINDLVEDNPLVQAIRYVTDERAYKYPQPLYVDELEQKWRYRLDLNRVLDYLSSKGVFVRTRFPGSDRIVLFPGKTLRELLKRFPSTKGFFRDVVKAITGLAMVRYLTDAETHKFRTIYATLQAIAACINEGKREPVYEMKGYKCKLCGKNFASKSEVKTHIPRDHLHEIECTDEDCVFNYTEAVTRKQVSECCKYAYFVEEASVYGVSRINKFLRYLLTKGAIIPQEEDEITIDCSGEGYVAVDTAWIRVRERTRALERQIVRVR